MNHFYKNPDAPSRLAREARCVQVRGFSKAYQRGTEFKARQMWLDFQDAVGTALEAISEVVDKSRREFRAWLKAFRMPEPMELPSLLQMVLPLFVEWFPMNQKRAA